MPADARRRILQNIREDADAQGSDLPSGLKQTHSEISVGNNQDDTAEHEALNIPDHRIISSGTLPKLLLISEIFPPHIGGSGQYFWELIRHMPKDRIVVMTGEYPGAEEFDQKSGINIVRVPMRLTETGALTRRGSADYRRLSKIAQELCQTHNIECVWAGRCVPEGWVARSVSTATSLPFIVSAHGEEVTLPGAGMTTGVMTSRQHRWMARRVFRKMTGAVANSNNTREILRTQWHLTDSRLFRLTPGVDADFFKPADADPQIRNSLGWQQRSVLLTVGRLHARKGHDLLISALPSIRKRIPNVLYAIAGDGPERAALVKQTEELGLTNSVRFYGPVERATLLKMYQQTDLFVLPNHQVGTEIEGFGMVLLEAQACGKPVIAGMSGGTGEALQQFETGLLVNPTQSEQLASAVGMILENPGLYASMARAARSWVLNQFRWTTLTTEFGEIVTGLTQQRA